MERPATRARLPLKCAITCPKSTYEINANNYVFCSGQFVVVVSTIAIVFAIVFFLVGITTVYKGKAAATVTFAVSILVAFVPEGLPSVVTLL